MHLAPVIPANDPLPPEIILAANALGNQAGDLLMAASGLSLQAQRTDCAIDSLLRAIAAYADEARAHSNAARDLAERILALQMRAAS